MVAGAKGGQGCTTIAAVLAVLAAQNNQPTLLLDTRGDAAPTLGVSDPAPASTFGEAIANAEPCRGLRVAMLAGDRIDADAINAIGELVALGHRVIVDTGTDHDVLHRFDPLHTTTTIVTVTKMLHVDTQDGRNTVRSSDSNTATMMRLR